ncbi:hypothetical protein MUB18_17320 [Sphingobacterium sp. PCS056]|uniref:hypothetical protein n=1 Tax=Sphingobacterium sp. PCS056 TaxID=2931400 RepID=UPI00200D1702|nr:hypothetical protein [Sphingobacterium sp. PCS056]UPZ35866.1 hypothetical protein MUB18_17320 [Sphingobacterium sp. PCS056]
MEKLSNRLSLSGWSSVQGRSVGIDFKIRSIAVDKLETFHHTHAHGVYRYWLVMSFLTEFN